MTGFGLRRVEVRGFRSARDVVFEPGPVCALVGGAGVGKSNLLAAIRALLDPEAREPAESIRGWLADGAEVTAANAPRVRFLPAAERAGGPGPRELVRWCEQRCRERAAGTVLLIEEPELYLPPQAQRYLYRLLRRFAECGNQVVYSTHSPAFLSVAHLDEIVFVERHPEAGTRTVQPEGIMPDDDFRVLTEFDAERAELFLARAAVLVEGDTERLTLPFVFAALGHDADGLGISIVECGGKPNVPLFVRVCRAVRLPYVVLHDRDRPTAAERELNALILAEAGEERTIVLDPDFEAVAGLHGRRHKPERAWRRFASLRADEIPEPLARAVRLAVRLAGNP